MTNPTLTQRKTEQMSDKKMNMQYVGGQLLSEEVGGVTYVPEQASYERGVRDALGVLPEKQQLPHSSKGMTEERVRRVCEDEGHHAALIIAHTNISELLTNTKPNEDRIV